ncbi:nitrilase-related carbon-nitrogen hydrolase, partial [Nocardioides kribbensis]|uniref:nitrilase-related carbon-nitrogen hydrolase n=1 Tax=Nocardioides kribbensis TaxID=305517 RepID=UPI0032D9C78B
MSEPDLPDLPVAVAQPRVHRGDLAATAREHALALASAGARLVVFPELSLTGYELDAEPVALDDPRWAVVVEACARAGAVALVGASVAVDDRLFIATVRVDAD